MYILIGFEFCGNKTCRVSIKPTVGNQCKVCLLHFCKTCSRHVVDHSARKAAQNVGSTRRSIREDGETVRDM